MDSSPTSESNCSVKDLVLPDSIQRYFESANAGEFEQTAALFADEGQMVPPFEKPIVGKDAIAQYLTKEATGMTFTPLQCEPLDLAASELDRPAPSQSYLIRGKVKTAVFLVNVAWEFALDEAQEISTVKIRLLAKLNELLKLKS